jgi:hypothetical protein
MSEPVTLNSEQLVLLIKRAEIAGYKKCANALRSEELWKSLLGIKTYTDMLNTSRKWLLDKQDKVLE